MAFLSNMSSVGLAGIAVGDGGCAVAWFGVPDAVGDGLGSLSLSSGRVVAAKS